MSKVFTLSSLWAVLLIIPGLLKLVQYSFVHYIVLFNPFYRIRKISALKHSSKLMKGFVVWFLLMGLFHIGMSYFVGYFTQDVMVFFPVGVIALKGIWIFSSSFFIFITYHLIYLKQDQGLHKFSDFYEKPSEDLSNVV